MNGYASEYVISMLVRTKFIVFYFLLDVPEDVDISIPAESEYLIQEDKWFIPVEVVGDIDADSKHGLREGHIRIIFRIASFVVKAIQIISSQSSQIQQTDAGIGKFFLDSPFDKCLKVFHESPFPSFFGQWDAIPLPFFEHCNFRMFPFPVCFHSFHKFGYDQAEEMFVTQVLFVPSVGYCALVGFISQFV